MNDPRVLLVACLLANAAFATETTSSFGFTVDLSDDWVVLTPAQSLAAGNGMSAKDFGLPAESAPRLEEILAKIEGGKVDFYLDKKFSTPEFTNNISLQLAPQDGPMTEGDAAEICRTLPEDLAAFLGRPTAVARCGLRRVGGVAFVAYEYSPGVGWDHTVQYEMPFFDRTKLVIVGGTNDSGLAHVRSAQDRIAERAAAFVHEQCVARLRPEWQAAYALINERKPANAVQRLERSLSTFEHARTYSMLALARHANGDALGAAKAMQTALRIDRSELKIKLPVVAAARALIELGHAPQAQEMLEKHVTVRPESAEEAEVQSALDEAKRAAQKPAGSR